MAAFDKTTPDQNDPDHHEPDQNGDRTASPDHGGDRRSFSLTTLTGLGLANAVSLAIGLFLGHYLDNRFGTAPVLVLVGLASGLTLGAVGSFLEIRRYLQD